LNTEPTSKAEIAQSEVDYESKYGTKDVVVKKLPYHKKIIEEIKEEPKDKKKKKGKKKDNNLYEENDNLGLSNNEVKKSSNIKKRKISDRSEKYSKKKLSHNDLEEYDFNEVLVDFL
jgi:hypothetical protein